MLLNKEADKTLLHSLLVPSSMMCYFKNVPENIISFPKFIFHCVTCIPVCCPTPKHAVLKEGVDVVLDMFLRRGGIAQWDFCASDA